MKAFNLILIALVIVGPVGCATEKNDIFNQTEVDEPEGPGLFSGEDGKITIEDLTKEEKQKTE